MYGRNSTSYIVRTTPVVYSGSSAHSTTRLSLLVKGFTSILETLKLKTQFKLKRINKICWRKYCIVYKYRISFCASQLPYSIAKSVIQLIQWISDPYTTRFGVINNYMH